MGNRLFSLQGTTCFCRYGSHSERQSMWQNVFVTVHVIKQENQRQDDCTGWKSNKTLQGHYKIICVMSYLLLIALVLAELQCGSALKGSCEPPSQACDFPNSSKSIDCVEEWRQLPASPAPTPWSRTQLGWSRPFLKDFQSQADQRPKAWRASHRKSSTFPFTITGTLNAQLCPAYVPGDHTISHTTHKITSQGNISMSSGWVKFPASLMASGNSNWKLEIKGICFILFS